MASWIDYPKVRGVAPEASKIDTHLLDADGHLRDFATVEREIGDNQAVLTLLEYHLRERLQQPKTRGYPPRLFLSYRHESVAHVAWCVELATRLRSAGYSVHLDVLDGLGPTSSPEQVAAFVAHLADSDIAVPIITSSYLGIGDTNAMRSWLFEEWVRILYLRDWGFLEIVAVHREGDLDGDQIVKLSGSLDAIVDLRSDPANMAPVLDFFGTYAGPKMTAESSQLLANQSRAAMLAAGDGDVARASRLVGAIQAAGHVETEEYWLAVAWLSQASGNTAELLRAGEWVLGANATLPTTYSTAAALWLGDLDADAIGMLAEAGEARSLWSAELHSMLGDAFARIGVIDAALNHLGWGLRSQLEAGLDPWLGRSSGIVLDLLGRQADLQPLQVERQGDHSVCGYCDASYAGYSSACLLCGCSYGPQAGESCVLCGAPVVGLSEFWFCPICRIGRKGTPDEGRNFHLVPREPKGRFSVLGRPASVPLPPSGAQLNRPLGALFGRQAF